MSCVQQFAATCGASRLATAQAEGGFMMPEPRPEMSQRLFDASSQANTSGGICAATFLAYSRTWRVRSEEHTSELQSRQYLECRLLLEKKKHATVPNAKEQRARLLVLSRARKTDGIMQAWIKL